MAREYTKKLSDAVFNGLLSAYDVMNMCLSYMSEDDIKDMCQANDLEFFDDLEDEDEEETE